MTPLKKLIYLPEGNYQDPENYSGTPLYLGKALKESCEAKDITFKVVDVPEMINTEELYALAAASVSKQQNLETLWLKLPREQRSNSAAKTLYKALLRTSQDHYSAVGQYVRQFKALTERRLEPHLKDETSVLALNTLNPPVSIPINYYLDSPLVPLYFESNLGFVSNRGQLPGLEKLFWRQEAQAMATARNLFFFSQNAAESTNRNYPGTQGKCEVVGAGINFDYWPETSASETNSRKRLRILFVGRDFYRKGGDVLLQAAQQLPANLFLITIVTERCFHVDAPETVQFLPPLEKGELEALYRSHDIFVFPTQREPFGLVVCEAMSFGLPVIATYVDAIPEILGPASVYWNPFVKSASDIVNRIQLLYTSPSLRDAVGQKNRLESSKRFRWAMVAEKMLQLITQNKEKNL